MARDIERDALPTWSAHTLVMTLLARPEQLRDAGRPAPPPRVPTTSTATAPATAGPTAPRTGPTSG